MPFQTFGPWIFSNSKQTNYHVRNILDQFSLAGVKSTNLLSHWMGNSKAVPATPATPQNATATTSVRDVRGGRAMARHDASKGWGFGGEAADGLKGD